MPSKNALQYSLCTSVHVRLTAPVSSLTEGILPLIRLEKKGIIINVMQRVSESHLEKNESGIHVNVCLEVENLIKREIMTIITGGPSLTSLRRH